ncbi:hypothetical protein N7527_005477, partial [Penicillium freii]
QFLDFREKDAIRTKDLRLYSVVVIASAYSIILVYIPPQPQATINLISSNTNVGTLYRDKRQFFPSAETIIIYTLDIIQISLIGLRLTTKIISYEVPGNSTIVGKGIVIIIKKRDYIKPKILVENRYIYQSVRNPPFNPSKYAFLREFLNRSVRNSCDIRHFYEVIIDTIRSNKVYLVKELLRYNIPISSIYILEAIRGKAKDILTVFFDNS